MVGSAIKRNVVSVGRTSMGGTGKTMEVVVADIAGGCASSSYPGDSGILGPWDSGVLRPISQVPLTKGESRSIPTNRQHDVQLPMSGPPLSDRPLPAHGDALADSGFQRMRTIPPADRRALRDARHPTRLCSLHGDGVSANPYRLERASSVLSKRATGHP